MSETHEQRMEGLAHAINEISGLRVTAAQAEVLFELAIERHRQVDGHGWTPEHDDRHDLATFGWLLSTRSIALSCPFPEDMVSPDPRRQLVEVAAIAVAALESWDRKHPRS